MRVLLVILLTFGIAFAQDYPKAKKRTPNSSTKTTTKTTTKKKTKPKKMAKRPINKVSGTFTQEGQTMKLADGVAIYSVSENRLAKTRRPEVHFYFTDTPFKSSEMKEIRGLVYERMGRYDIRKILENRGGKWLVLDFTFNPKNGLYTARSAQWYFYDFSWKKGSGSSLSIMGDGLNKLPAAHPVLNIDPARQRLRIQSRYQGWDMNLDMTMWTLDKF